MHHSQNQRAFTLIEALITLAIAGILIHSGAPALSTALKRYQLNTFAEQSLALIQASRLEAISRANPVTWCPLNNQNECKTENAAHLAVFEDSNNNQILDSGETLIAQAPLATEQQVAMNGHKDTIRFLANGRTYQPASVYLCIDGVAKKLTVSFTGRIYQLKEETPLNCPD